MSKNDNLNKARRNKNDEFYTQLSDIERELRHYKNHFKDKVIYCNTDDYRYSQFFYYFFMNFKHLGLKKLIATSYNDEGKGLGTIYDGEPDDSNIPSMNNVKKFELEGNGDFRTDECVEFLKESDIVVTNPPFSLFREFVDQLMEYEKSFLIIGNVNAIKYRDIFPLIKENKIWIGVSPRSMDFILDDGKKKSVNSQWFTNIDNYKRHEEIILYKKYNENDYPKYDNCNAIEVSIVKKIPMDYDDYIGVPITFMDKFNPEQFEIVGSNVDLSNPIKFDDGKIGSGAFYVKKDNIYNRIYARIIIKNKKIIEV